MQRLILVWIPVTVVPTSLATVAIETFMTELSSIIRNCPAQRVIRIRPAAPAPALRAIFKLPRSRRARSRSPRPAPRGRRSGRSPAPPGPALLDRGHPSAPPYSEGGPIPSPGREEIGPPGESDGRGRLLRLALLGGLSLRVGRRHVFGLARDQHFFGDDQALDLAGPLVELHDLCVAHQFLDRVLLDEAVAAVDLDGVGGDLHRRVGGEALGHRGDAAVADALGEQERGGPGQQAAPLDLG